VGPGPMLTRNPPKKKPKAPLARRNRSLGPPGPWRPRPLGPGRASERLEAVLPQREPQIDRLTFVRLQGAGRGAIKGFLAKFRPIVGLAGFLQDNGRLTRSWRRWGIGVFINKNPRNINVL
jgi:hypothetical protein